jgi:hypothetical protein
MSRQSVAKAHQKIQELSWEPQYHEPVSQYGTDYTFHKAQKKDPLKQVLRSYFPMQEEKDNRVYGAQDGAIRGNMFRQVQERWLEWQKLFLSIIPLPEISAARAMPLLFRTVPAPDSRLRVRTQARQGWCFMAACMTCLQVNSSQVCSAKPQKWSKGVLIVTHVAKLDFKV